MNDKLPETARKVRSRRDADTEALLDSIRDALGSQRLSGDQKLRRIEQALDGYDHPSR